MTNYYSIKPINLSAYRTAMVDALNKALEIFCFHGDAKIDQVITNGLYPIADVMNVNRIIVYRNIDINGEMRLKQLYRWVREKRGLAVASLYFLPDNLAINGWLDILRQDICINQRLSDMSDDEAAFMNIYGVKSVFVVPIFTLGEFWGCVTFQDHINERLFDDECMDLTRSFAYLCVNAIIRDEMVREMAEKHELNRVIFDAAPVGLTMFDENYNFIDCNEAVLEMYNVSKTFYLTHFFDLSPEYQPDGSKSHQKLRETMKRVIKGEKLHMEWTHCLPAGEPFPCEITMTRVKHKGKYLGLGYIYDLRGIKRMEENIKWLQSEATKAYLDPLTGINNRRYFDENLKRVVKTVSRSRNKLTLMMVDVDFFKAYNDTYGHAEGDKCLKIIAETLSKSLTRGDDFVARYGGEEFAVVLPNTPESGARKIADKLIENIRACDIPHKHNIVADHVTISIGVATGKGGRNWSVSDFINSADEMLYKSKKDGRDRYSFTTI